MESKAAFSPREIKKMGGPGTTTVYNEINAGRLRAVKCGRKTMILAEDLRDWLSKLPQIEPKTRNRNAAEKGA